MSVFPMRVLHIHSGNLYGGVEALLATLARNRDLCPEMEPHYALCFEGCLSEELIDAGAAMHLLGNTRISKPLTIWRARRMLSDLLQRETFDVAICHSTWSQSLFGSVTRRAALPMVFWLHSPTNGKSWLDRLGQRTIPDLVLCNSQFTAAMSRNFYPQVPKQVLYAPVLPSNGASSPADRAATRAELQTPQDAIVIMQASRMEPWKGHALHLEALGQLKDLPDWVCWQVGGAQRPGEIEYQNSLKRRAEQLGIADRISFLGQRLDVPKLMAAADIYCQPNTAPEPFGIAFIEALYAGLPVVTTALGGAREIVDETCGVLVTGRDSHALANSLYDVIQDRTRRIELGTAGAKRARRLCNPPTQMAALQRMLALTVLERSGCSAEDCQKRGRWFRISMTAEVQTCRSEFSEN